MSGDRSLELRAGTDEPELIRLAHDELGRERLAREAARLEQAHHPGVVPLLSHEEDRLVLGWVGGHTLETIHPPVETTAAIIASVSSTLADLHRIGLVHGRIEASHIVIDEAGRPLLCGFRGLDDGDAEPSDDVRAIGHLLDRLVGRSAELEPIPERRWRRRRWSGFERRALQTLVDRATDPDPTRRPTARQLAKAITDVVPGAAFEPVDQPSTSVPPSSNGIDDDRGCTSQSDDPAEQGGRDDGPTDSRPFDAESGDDEDIWIPEPEPAVVEPSHVIDRSALDEGREDHRVGVAGSPSRHIPVLALAAMALVFAVLGIVRIGSAGSPDSTDDSGTSPETDRAADSSGDGFDCELDHGPDLDGDGCPDPVSVDGNHVIAAGRRYLIGDPGDRIHVADWRCDGNATVALLRPETGEVFAFDDWATDNEPMTTTPVAIVADAVDLAEPDDDRCRTTIVHRDGSTTSLDLRNDP